MIAIDKCPDSWRCAFHGESGTEYIAILVNYDGYQSLCNILYFDEQMVGHLVFCCIYSEKPSPEVLHTAINAFLGYKIKVDYIRTPYEGSMNVY